MARIKGRITKEALLPLVGEGLGIREIGKRLDRGPTSIRYWLRTYGLETNPTYHSLLASRPRRCGRCGETSPEQFYGKKKSICGPCHNRYTLEAGKRRKAKAREHLGGKCAACGFDRFPSALAIHHKNPAVKDPKFHGMRGWSWTRIEEELRDCVLLCSNCHVAYHAGELETGFDTGL